MKLKYDIELDIATAHSRLAKRWKNRKWKWSQLVEKCSETRYTGETLTEYLKMPKNEQSDIKDVGGFVGGYLNGGQRKSGSVMWRSCATLDVDFGTPDLWDDFCLNYNCAALLYTTHKSTKEKPRYRLVIPFSRNVKPDEYEPICRKIADNLNISLFDPTTYQLPRLFYWPSTSKGGIFEFNYNDAPFLNPDKVLSEYVDYHDVASWPTSPTEDEKIAHEIKKAGDPIEKPGLIGAFCRAYDIESAINIFLSDVYEKTAHGGRYTYKKGTVAAGLVCYDDKFAYSFHETDPAGGQLCNAFDLCRIHLFGVQDEGTKQTDITKMPSYLKMQDFVSKDKKVRVLLTREKKASIDEDFDDINIEDGETDSKWMESLEYDRKGSIKPTSTNIVTILENDHNLKNHLWHDLFSGFDIVKGGLPWDKEATQWRSRDDANLRIYMDEHYGISGKDKIRDATAAVLTRHQVHPIKDYLNSLKWDGKPRLDKLIIDYIGAEDTPLNRAMTRKHFTAAVARVMEPGCKYDYCLIIAGAEGIGKSTLFSIMGGDWFSDSIVTMEGKQGMEQVQNGWVIELPELGSMKRSDVETIKAFISRQNDMYRPAYGSVMESHPRQCVFCGTTNETYFLKGDTGNRRFWVMHVNAELRKYDNMRETLQANRDQIWAEAVERYNEGEPLFLNAEMEAEARQRQQQFNDNADDPLVGMVQAYLDAKLPPDWETYDLNRRRAYIKNPDPLDAEATEPRTKACAAEFLCENMNANLSDKDFKYKARQVNKIIAEMGWIKATSMRFTIYGIQRGFRKPINESEDDDL